jgi:hypothetical protein
MRLTLNGHSLRIGQMGPNFLILDDTIDHPPSRAEIFFSVDGNEERWTVNLPNGLQAGRKRVLISRSKPDEA